MNDMASILDRETVARFVSTAAGEVFLTMFGLEMTPVEGPTELDVIGTEETVVAMVGFSGDWAGTGSITCGPDLARIIAGHMLMMDTPTAIDNDVLDAVAEVANMVVGSAKTSLEEIIGPVGMSVPTVIYGRNFVVHSASDIPTICLSFLVCDLPFRVNMSLAPAPGASRGDGRRTAQYMLAPA